MDHIYLGLKKCWNHGVICIMKVARICLETFKRNTTFILLLLYKFKPVFGIQLILPWIRILAIISWKNWFKPGSYRKIVKFSFCFLQIQLKLKHFILQVLLSVRFHRNSFEKNLSGLPMIFNIIQSETNVVFPKLSKVST